VRRGGVDVISTKLKLKCVLNADNRSMLRMDVGICVQTWFQSLETAGKRDITERKVVGGKKNHRIWYQKKCIEKDKCDMLKCTSTETLCNQSLHFNCFVIRGACNTFVSPRTIRACMIL
jgi:hypothetical protein